MSFCGFCDGPLPKFKRYSPFTPNELSNQESCPRTTSTRRTRPWSLTSAACQRTQACSPEFPLNGTTFLVTQFIREPLGLILGFYRISAYSWTPGHSPLFRIGRGSGKKKPIVIVGARTLNRLRFGAHRLYRTPMAKAVLFGQNCSFEFRPPKHPNRCSQHSKPSGV